MAFMSLTERLIEEVKAHKILYDLKDPEYKNLRKKDKLWDDIGQILNKNGEELKKKWKNIRDCYQKYLKSIQTKADLKRNYKNWQWSEQMDYFRPYVSISKTSVYVDNSEESEAVNSPNISSFNEEFEDSFDNTGSIKEEMLEITPTQIQEVNRNKQTKRKSVAVEDESSSSVDSIANHIQSKKRYTVSDATDLIFLGYSNIVKSFPPKRQAIIKMKIAQIVMEEEIRNAE